MQEKRISRKIDGEKEKTEISFKAPEEEKLERTRYTHIPVSYYWLKDLIKDFLSQKTFPDALAIIFASFSASIAFPFFPPIILLPLLLLTFIATLYSPLIGLMALLFETLPMIMYQTPLLAWIMILLMSAALFISHKHYRSITFVYALILLPMSYLGTYLEIPAFIIGVLFIGFRRAVISTILIILLLAMLSGLTGLQNSAPLIYNATAAHRSLSGNQYLQFMVPSSAPPTLQTFMSSEISSIVNFFSFSISSGIGAGAKLAVSAISYNFELLVAQILAWLLVVFAMTNYVIKSRSGFKGTEASFFSLLILVTYIVLSYFTNAIPKISILGGFLITPVAIFILEYNGIEVVRALAVMKQDFLGKFGEAFQDLTSGTKETLEDVANYDETKDELRQAILAPIEHREISGAYKVKAAKGILLFGPPGTGKTLIMRAIANEIRAKFFYVKTSAILSPFQGESAQTLSRIFDTVKKNTPAILFFDEIDGIAGSREAQENDGNRQLLSTLLSEMDGFQKIDGVVIIGSTNVPQLLDKSIMRPGRFDKIIYMPLPDSGGRAKILGYYLKKLPIGADISYPKLAELTSRYSGADIKNICNEVARVVADDAVKQHKILQISMADVVRIIKATKPSTSLGSIEKYNSFKVDYERRTHPETLVEDEDKVKIDDVMGLEDAKKALYEAVEIPILHPNLVKKYDLQNIKGILLFGPPGTGKTMLMRAVANELEGVSLITIQGSDVAKNGLENALNAIKEAFNRARENAPSIIFIDELDSLLPNRNDASELAVQVTSEILQQIDGIKTSGNIVIVGSTNRPDSLEPAILRPGRLDKFIFVPPPNVISRMMIFKANISKAPHDEDIDYNRLAELTEGFTGADIVNICRETKMKALEESVASSTESAISMKDLTDMIKKVKPSAPASTLARYMNFVSIYGGR